MASGERVIGVIGGSGVYQLEGLKGDWERVVTPYGEPSDALLVGELHGQRVVFLPRHGRGHRRSPTEINFRANIAALKQLGVTDVISVSAVGSLKEDLPPGTFVIVDQFIDRTFERHKTFFEGGVVGHVSMAHPTCGRLGEVLEGAAREAGVKAKRGGTLLVMEGPQFSTLAESKLYRQWGCDVIGMTAMPEAKLAREAELCYATLAMVTDFDCWHPEHDHVTVGQVVETLARNAGNARKLVAQAVTKVKAGPCPQGCDHALDAAIITAPESRVAEAIAKLRHIGGRVLHMPRKTMKELIRTIPDFPKKGIQFRDVTTLLKDPAGLREAVDALAARYRNRGITKVIGIEARGFILGAPLAYALGAGFVPVRKKGKLPGEAIGQSYALEYGSDSVEMHLDALSVDERVVVVDDLIATGGTAEAAVNLVRRAGAKVEEACFLVELPELNGRERLTKTGVPVHALISFEGH
jgi:5'-methylthioadenosine phosphorylase